MCKLRKCREKCGYSQKQVAFEIGVKPPTVSQWESGVKIPSRKNIAKLAALYGVTVDYLLDRADEQPEIAARGLNAEEMKLIQDYRGLNKQGQEYIRQTMYMATSIYKKCSDIPGMENMNDTIVG